MATFASHSLPEVAVELKRKFADFIESFEMAKNADSSPCHSHFRVVAFQSPSNGKKRLSDFFSRNVIDKSDKPSYLDLRHCV